MFLTGAVLCKRLVTCSFACYLLPQLQGESSAAGPRSPRLFPARSRENAMPADAATAVKSAQKAQRELEDLQLVVKARNGSEEALDALMRRYTGFVRLKASSYFLAGG